MNKKILFFSPTVFQKRNEHDLLRDFEEEKEEGGELEETPICLIECFAIDGKRMKAKILSGYTIKVIKDALRYWRKRNEEMMEDQEVMSKFRDTLNHIFNRDELLIYDMIQSRFAKDNEDGFKHFLRLENYRRFILGFAIRMDP